MKPTVGRIVHYNIGSRVRAAIITGLYANGAVSTLTLFTGSMTDPVRILHGVPFSEESQEGHWSWPPKV